MHYVLQSLGSGEELVHVGRFHWMYTFQASLKIVWGVIFCILIVYGGDYYNQNYGHGGYSENLLTSIRLVHPAVKLVAFMSIIMGFLQFAQMMVVKATTEIAITNKRLVYKKGLVARYVGEMSIDRIEGVNVLQGILGRMLGYGRVMVRGMGVGEVILPPLEDPVTFRKAIMKARESKGNDD